MIVITEIKDAAATVCLIKDGAKLHYTAVY